MRAKGHTYVYLLDIHKYICVCECFRARTGNAIDFVGKEHNDANCKSNWKSKLMGNFQMVADLDLN